MLSAHAKHLCDEESFQNVPHSLPLSPGYKTQHKQNYPIAMKLKLNILCHLLNIYTKLEIDTSKHVEKKFVKLGQMDLHCHSIIWPFFKQDYKNTLQICFSENLFSMMKQPEIIWNGCVNLVIMWFLFVNISKISWISNHSNFSSWSYLKWIVTVCDLFLPTVWQLQQISWIVL